MQFKTPGGTSRGVLREKRSWFISVVDSENPEVCGIGECGILAGLSADDRPDFEQALQRACGSINQPLEIQLANLREWPSIRFAVEMAMTDLRNGGQRMLVDSSFTRGKSVIPINGLVWMGGPGFMEKQIEEKIEAGYTCIKLKIGAIDFEEELKLIQGIRSRFSASDIEIRVDANGAFSPEEALDKLSRLAVYDLHSIEQPIAAGQLEAMAQLCAQTPLPIALDEELIGVFHPDAQREMLAEIRPQFIILKPSLVGGWKASEDWIASAKAVDAGWWITSALESNVGLNAIAQWTSTLNVEMPQGLGTGQLYTNNFASPLEIHKGTLRYTENHWNLETLFSQPWSKSS